MKKALSLIAFAVAAASPFRPTRSSRGAGGREELQVPVDLAREPDAAGQLQDVRRACRQTHRRAGEDRGASAAGSIVPPFEILDATAQEGDRRRPRASPITGSARTSGDAVLGDAGRPVGMDHFDFLGWMNEGGGMDLYWEFSATSEAERRRLADRRRESAGARLVQAADQERRRLQGAEVPANRHRGRDLPAHGKCRPSICRAAR